MHRFAWAGCTEGVQDLHYIRATKFFEDNGITDLDNYECESPEAYNLWYDAAKEFPNIGPLDISVTLVCVKTSEGKTVRALINPSTAELQALLISYLDKEGPPSPTE